MIRHIVRRTTRVRLVGRMVRCWVLCMPRLPEYGEHMQKRVTADPLQLLGGCRACLCILAIGWPRNTHLSTLHVRCGNVWEENRLTHRTSTRGGSRGPGSTLAWHFCFQSSWCLPQVPQERTPISDLGLGRGIPASHIISPLQTGNLYYHGE
jgi:hypothetical protein